MKRLVCILPALAVLAAAQSPAFEVASVKPARPDGRDRFQSECADGGRYISRGTPLLWAIEWAYGLNDYQVNPGWPDWLNSFDTYDIEAAPEGRVTQDLCRAMVRSLFEDRFNLRMHKETKSVSAYALVVGKNGPRFPTGGRVTINGAVKRSASEREPPQGWTMPRLANYLASVRAIGRPVLDQTGLTGIYGLTPNFSTSDRDDRPDVFTAVEEQLGLKLERVKAQIEMSVVDHVEKPTVN